MIQGQYLVRSNTPLTKSMMQFSLEGDTSAIKAPGQFVNIKLDGFYLRRSISVCNVDGELLTLIYKVVGRGTEAMSRMQPGGKLNALVGLGNGYSLDECGDKPMLIGGGAGVPPMFLLARRLLARGADVTVVLGFNAREEIFYEEEFRALGAKVMVATADGSYGVRGFVTDAMKQLPAPSAVCACGPEPMLKAVYNAADVPGQFSFESRMGCGFGACMGCTCKTKYGAKRICKDGPVLRREEIVW